MVITFSNIKGTGGGGTISGITFLNSDYTLDFIESAITSALTDSLSGYTPTSGFCTINGSAITEGGDLIISGGTEEYSAGTNIDITDNVISVTGITIPTSNTAFTNDAGYITNDALSGYTPSSGFSTINGSAITEGGDITVEGTPYSGGSNIDVTDHVISVTGITVPTSNTAFTNDAGYIVSGDLKTVDNQTLIGSGNIPVGEKFVKLTQSEYDALTAYTSGTTYIITDAPSINMTAYTPTSGFSTINGSAITEGGNIVISGGSEYSAGTNIDITDNVISVTGITIPTSNTAFTNDAGYITDDALTGYSTTEQMTSAITDATSGKMDTSAISAYTPTSGFSTINGSAITEGGNITVEETPYSAGTNIDITDHVISVTGITIPTSNTAFTNDAGYVTSAEVETRVDEVELVTSTALNELHNKFSDYTPTSGFSTINGSAITEGGDIVISGGSGGEQVVELTQAQYNALTAYSENTTYIITDASSVDVDSFATTGDLQSYYTSAQTDTAISNAVSGKTDMVSVTANTGRQFPRWNTQGVVTGTTGNTVYEQNLNINGTSKTMLQTTNSSFGTIYAPTTVGTQGQPLLSNGSGAPVWATYKFAFITQTAYDALTTKDSTTIYFITGD